MAHALDEVEDFVKISSGLLINMGTLSSDWVASKKLAAIQVGGSGPLSTAGVACAVQGGCHDQVLPEHREVVCNNGSW